MSGHPPGRGRRRPWTCNHLAALSTGRFYLTAEQRADLGRRIGEILLDYSPTTNPENRGDGAEKLYYVLSFLPGDLDAEDAG
jgi:hypothetical protein